MAIFFCKGGFITERNTTRYILTKAARKSHKATDKALGAIVNAHQPFLQMQNEVASTLISSGINLALIRYKLHRQLYQVSCHDDMRGNYYVHLAKDLTKLIWDIAWAFLEPMVWALINTIIYAVVFLSFFGLIFYVLFIL